MSIYFSINIPWSFSLILDVVLLLQHEFTRVKSMPSVDCIIDRIGTQLSKMTDEGRKQLTSC